MVNNNAASLFLLLQEVAKGREVIVSRGEQIQIGGGFRIPDILALSGAKLVEVGTTNITTAKDYLDAITDQTALVLMVHRSNFAIRGFTESPRYRRGGPRPARTCSAGGGSGVGLDHRRVCTG